MGQAVFKPKNGSKKKDSKTKSSKNDKVIAADDDPKNKDKESSDFQSSDSESPAGARASQSNATANLTAVKSEIVVALYGHSARVESELSHDKGERFQVLDKPDSESPAGARASQSNATANLTAVKSEIVVALYGHSARVESELSHDKGERFQVLDKPNADWWWVRNLETQKEGFVFANYVVSATSLEIQEWFFGDFSRKEAEKILLKDPTMPDGTFLVRLAESSSTHKYSLSVRVNHNGQAIVKHHRVFFLNDEFYIHKNRTFTTLHDLISHYSRNEYGFQILLTQVCPKPMPPQWDLSPNTRDEWEIDRNALKCDERLGSGNFGEVWHGLWNGTREVAVKTLKEGTMSADAFLQEATIMKKLRHKNILILYAVCTEQEPILIITEYMNKGALLEVLRNDGHRLTLPDLVDICAQVTD
ncbi:Serine-threonine/tyrosine-protein kinase catalytic domain [Trinorchestia longiramus]|nr:Serine-threonine/tyrosine-protein kinase catalytic domain [Trinorchestia longiramus]